MYDTATIRTSDPRNAWPRSNKEEILNIPVEVTNNVTGGSTSSVGATPLTGSSTDFRKLFVDDAQKWAKVMHDADIKPE